MKLGKTETSEAWERKDPSGRKYRRQISHGRNYICDYFIKTSYILKEANIVKSWPTHTPTSTRSIISPKNEQQKTGLPKKINKVNIRRGKNGTE